MQKVNSSDWYNEPGDNAHASLMRVFRTVRDANQWRVDADELHAGFYAGALATVGVRGVASGDYTYAPSVLPYNVARSATDTLVAKIAQHRPLPVVLTQRGDWSQQKRAKKLTQFIEGEFYNQHLFEKKARVIVRDACIFGRGILAVYNDKKDIVTERVFPWELFFDDWDARYGDPLTVYHQRSADREKLRQRFYKLGKSKRAIDEAVDGATTLGHEQASRAPSQTNVDHVDFVEAYRLPLGDEPGRHIVATSAGILLDEEWEQKSFPYVILTYSDAITGVYGQGLVEQLEGYQYEINVMAQKVSESHNLLGGAWVLVPQGSDIVETHLQNGLGTIVRHKPGLPPQVIQPNPVHPQTYQRLRDLPVDAYNDVGISQMSAQSKKPAGVTAAVALQTLDDQETQRFIMFGRAYESFCLDVARRLIDCAKRIADEFGDYSVSVPMKGGIVDLSWDDVEIDGFQLRVFSSSVLPQQPAARLERLMQFFNSQVIDKDQLLRMIEPMDLQSEFDLTLAPTLAVEERLEAMMQYDRSEGFDEEDAYLPPNPFMPLQWAAKRAQQYLDRGDVNGMPDFVASMLRRFIIECEALLVSAKPPQAAGGAPIDPLSAQVTPPAPMPGGPMPQMPGVGAI